MIDDPKDRSLAVLSNVQALVDDHLRLALHAQQVERALDGKNRLIEELSQQNRTLIAEIQAWNRGQKEKRL